MSNKIRRPRLDERTVDCIAARAAYEILQKENPHKAKACREELGAGPLSRILGGTNKSSRQNISNTNIEKFSKLCDIEIGKILFNNDGDDEGKEEIDGHKYKDYSLSYYENPEKELREVIFALEHYHTNPEGIYWIGQTLVECRSILRRMGIKGAAPDIIESLLDDIDADTRAKEGVFDVFVSPRKIADLIDHLIELKGTLNR